MLIREYVQESKSILDEMIKETKGPMANGQEISVTNEAANEAANETGTIGDSESEAREHPNHPAEEANQISEDSAVAEADGGGGAVIEAVIPAGDSSDCENILTPTTSVRSGGTVRASDAPLADSVEATRGTQAIGEGTEDQNLRRQLVTQSKQTREQLQATNAKLAELIRLQEMNMTNDNRRTFCRSS